MAAEKQVDREHDDPELANGDSLSERVDAVNIEQEDTCSTDEMRELLGL